MIAVTQQSSILYYPKILNIFIYIYMH
jgi:hypothetical protein